MYELAKKKTHPFLKLLGFLLALSITAEVLKVIFQNPSIEEQLMNTAKEINKHCPIMIDSITRFDNSMALPNKKFQLNYTFIANDKSDIDTTILQGSMKTSFINTLKTDPKFKLFKQNDVSISATFYDKTGHYVCNLFIDPNQL